jgi:hypothetical protein
MTRYQVISSPPKDILQSTLGTSPHTKPQVATPFVDKLDNEKSPGCGLRCSRGADEPWYPVQELSRFGDRQRLSAHELCWRLWNRTGSCQGACVLASWKRRVRQKGSVDASFVDACMHDLYHNRTAHDVAPTLASLQQERRAAFGSDALC